MSNLGIPEKPSLSIESACGSGSVAFREAFANVAGGFYDAVLVTGVEKVTHTGTEWTTTYFSYCSDFFYEGQAGASFPGLFASMARAYLTEFNATEEDFDRVAVKNHDNGFLNPKAHLQKRITIDDVMNSAVVASPLKLYDCCPFSDGASSVILCSEKFAKEKGVQAVREGRTKLNSDISINPSGGLKSKGHPIGATGVGQVVEVFDQLTGRAGARTVKNAKIGLTHNFGATGASCAVHIFQSV